MPFMQVEVSGPESWIVLDGPYGMETIPCDVCGGLLDYDEYVEEHGSDDGYEQAAFDAVSDYAENRECWEIDEITGYCGRLAAPGYLDSTEWMGPYNSAKDARRAVIEAYELCPACEDSCQSPKSADNPACNFYHY